MDETNDNTKLVIIEGNSDSLEKTKKANARRKRNEALSDLGHEMLSAAIESSADVLAMHSRMVRLDGKPRRYRKE